MIFVSLVIKLVVLPLNSPKYSKRPDKAATSYKLAD